VTPDLVEQGVLGHQPAGRARQRAQHREGLRRQRYRFAVALQPGVGLIELEAIEVQSCERCIGFHASSPCNTVGMG
jgi:hypothetical protein